jgi:hypothetical protein
MVQISIDLQDIFLINLSIIFWFYIIHRFQKIEISREYLKIDQENHTFKLAKQLKKLKKEQDEDEMGERLRDHIYS